MKVCVHLAKKMHAWMHKPAYLKTMRLQLDTKRNIE